jgi:excisionase family DNA binding protein
MDILTKQDLAHYLKVSIQTVTYLLYSKQLPKIKVGREYRFLKSDIDQWVQKQRQSVKYYSFDKVS